MRPGLALAGKVRRAGHRAQTLLATSRPFAGCSSSFDSATSLPPRWKGVLFARPTRRSRRGGSGRCPPPPRPPRTRCPSGVCRPRAAAEALGGGGSRPAALAQLLLGWRGMGGDLKNKTRTKPQRGAGGLLRPPSHGSRVARASSSRSPRSRPHPLCHRTIPTTAALVCFKCDVATTTYATLPLQSGQLFPTATRPRQRRSAPSSPALSPDLALLSSPPHKQTGIHKTMTAAGLLNSVRPCRCGLLRRPLPATFACCRGACLGRRRRGWAVVAPPAPPAGPPVGRWSLTRAAARRHAPSPPSRRAPFGAPTPLPLGLWLSPPPPV